MTIEEMLNEARYHFYQSGNSARTVTDENIGIRYPHRESHAQSNQIGAGCGDGSSAQSGSISAWCEWINSYRDALDQDERLRRLESWRRAEGRRHGVYV